MARSEDVGINLMVVGESQVLDEQDWAQRMNVPDRDIGTGMTMQDVARMSGQADLSAVRAYRRAVGERTRTLVANVDWATLDETVPAHGVGTSATSWLRGFGFRPSRRLVEIWESYGSLTDAETRTAFVHALRSVIDQAGQRVNATDRLYLAAHLPTLIVWGDSDRIIPVQQAFTAHEVLPGSRLEIFEGTGHFPHCEEPERFVEVLTNFVESTAPVPMTSSQWRELLHAGSR